MAKQPDSAAARRLITELQDLAREGASVSDLVKIADVAEELAIDAEEAEEDRLAAEALKKFKPQKGDVITFDRVIAAWKPPVQRNGRVLKTPQKGDRRIQLAHDKGKRFACDPPRGARHIMIKRIVGVVSRARKAGPR